MSIIVGDGGQLEIGPEGSDPVRRGHARLVAELAWHLESNQQLVECHDVRIEQLLDRVAFLEQLLIGRAS